MTLRSSPLINIWISFLLPYIVVFSIYIQLKGEDSPGGGFQAGSLIASAIIIREFLTGKLPLTIKQMQVLATVGVLIYVLVGLWSFGTGDNYLNYYSLPGSKLLAQKRGVFIVELGVGLAISNVMLLIYAVLKE